MKRKIINVSLIIVMIIGLILLSGCGGLKESDKRNDFLENMINVSYITVDGYNVDKKLNTKLAELLNKLDSSAIDPEKSSNESKGETGEQAYVFRFYSKDDSLLYWLQYYSSNEEITIRTCSEKDDKVEFLDNHDINDRDVLNYIKSVIK